MLPKIKLSLDSIAQKNHCFVCGKDNPCGLKLVFTRDSNEAKAEFIPCENHQGWPGVIHGGIICALLDEAVSYSIYQTGISCVTARLNIRFKHLTPIGEKLLITGRVTKQTRKLIESHSEIKMAKDNTIVAEADGLLYVVDDKSRQ